MGFPTWTLIGMGVTGFGALVVIALAYVAQLPRFLARIGLAGARLDLRVRELTGLGLALVMLAFGFFLAGVPLGVVEGEQTAVSTPTVTVSAVVANDVMDEDVEGVAETAVSPSDGIAPVGSPESGAFGGPLATATPLAPIDTGGSAMIADDLSPSGTITFTTTPLPTNTVAATATVQATSTPTATPTVTPTPTLTPTPIVGETAVINTGGSTLWVRRTPGGQTLSLVRNGDLVILSSGHANQGGILWQEVRTVAGVLGWVQEEFLLANE